MSDKFIGKKKGVDYFQKENGTIYCAPLEQGGKIGGGHEEGRNSIENPIRLERIKQLQEKPFVLDWGCGHGLLVKYLNENGVTAYGYDKYNPDFCEKTGKVNIVTLIEVAEHFSEPFSDFDEIYEVLLDGGKVMIETSFSTWLKLEDDYINPEAGHSTIFSHEGLTEVMLSKGFKEGNHINRNVRIYDKLA